MSPSYCNGKTSRNILFLFIQGEQWFYFWGSVIFFRSLPSHKSLFSLPTSCFPGLHSPQISFFPEHLPPSLYFPHFGSGVRTCPPVTATTSLLKWSQERNPFSRKNIGVIRSGNFHENSSIPHDDSTIFKAVILTIKIRTQEKADSYNRFPLEFSPFMCSELYVHPASRRN